MIELDLDKAVSIHEDVPYPAANAKWMAGREKLYWVNFCGLNFCHTPDRVWAECRAEYIKEKIKSWINEL